jgi:hypothetical protein
MAFEMKENTGSLFKNDRREKDTHPNAQGTALINGVEYWVSAWTKKDKNGNPWQSLAFKPKTEAGTMQVKANKNRVDDDSDPIPF